MADDDQHTRTDTVEVPTEILGALTLDEKISLLHQHSPSIERLGLGAFHTGTEALHGLSWLGVATVFPQPVGLAATWDPAFLREVGDAVATEVRAKHALDPSVSLNVWAPVVNTLRHPLWGRTEEGYSEDPDVTAALAIGYCSGLRGDHPVVWKTVPTLKHFLGYGNETDRAATSSHLPPQSLREYELPAFQAPLAAGVVGAVMPAYNLVNGRPCHVSGELLGELRRHAPHSIAVVSDAQAPSNLVDGEFYFDDHVQAHAAALRAGVDSFTENGDQSAPTVERLRSAYDAGMISESDVDAAVLRTLELRARTGELAHEDPYSIRGESIDGPAHRILAREAAGRGVVLLTNWGALPLAAPTRIAVVGPFADHAAQDWYSGTPPYQSTIAGAMRERYPEAEVRVADGADRIGLRSRTHDRYLETGVDGRITASGTTLAEKSQFDLTEWETGVTTLRSVASGGLLTGADWIIRATASRVGGWVAQETFQVHAGDGAHAEDDVHARDGAAAGIRLQHLGSGKWLRVQHGTGLLVADGTSRTAERFDVTVLRSAEADVAAACAGADLAIVTAGNDPHIGGRETEDRPRLELPPRMRELWGWAREASSTAVLAVISSYPYAIEDEAARADAVLWTSHAGQELGHGVVDVLAGDRVPTGRLAQTWWRTGEDAGDLLEYDVVGVGMTYRYGSAAPLFGLGHGLGYSDVSYDAIRLSSDTLSPPPPTTTHTPARFVTHDAPPGGGDLEAIVTVRNTGSREVDELVAVYVLSPALAVRAPLRRLAAWTRVRLAPGEARDVTLPVPAGLFAVWDAGLEGDTVTPGAFRVQPGDYSLASGPSAARLDVSASVSLLGEVPEPRRATAIPAHGFHAHVGVVTSDLHRDSGSSIELHPRAAEGWARFDRFDLTGVTAVRAVLARRALDAWGETRFCVEFREDEKQHWRAITDWTGIPSTGRYDWTTLDLAMEPDASNAPLGAGCVRLRLEGAARIAELEFLR